MKLVSVSKRFFDLCSFDKELLDNTNRRPYLVVVRLKYKGHKQDFAIPFRSNIPTYTPKTEYFSLPPRKTTKKNNVHGLHYKKMFPITKEFLEKFHTDKDSYYKLVQDIIKRDLKQIIQEAQEYLNSYENGEEIKYSTNIDAILIMINSVQTIEEAALVEENK